MRVCLGGRGGGGACKGVCKRACDGEWAGEVRTDMYRPRLKNLFYKVRVMVGIFIHILHNVSCQLLWAQLSSLVILHSLIASVAY